MPISEPFRRPQRLTAIPIEQWQVAPTDYRYEYGVDLYEGLRENILRSMSSDVDQDTLADMKAQEKAARDKIKRQEAEQIKGLFENGHSPKLRMTMEDNGRLAIFKHTGPREALVAIDTVNRTMTANKKRTSHVKALLTKYAAREGLTLQLVQKTVELGEGVPVAYWSFNLGTVDDTQLLTTTITERNIRPEPQEEGAAELHGYYGRGNYVYIDEFADGPF